VIVGAGGGKVLDAARAAAMQVQRPFVSCPPIAFTDAPCSAISVVFSDDGVVVEILVHPVNPALVLVDSRVIAEAPARLLVAGMGDALSTMCGWPIRPVVPPATACYRALPCVTGDSGRRAAREEPRE